MREKAFQGYYPDHLAWCYGCGRLNEHGYQIKTYWDSDETVTTCCSILLSDHDTPGGSRCPI